MLAIRMQRTGRSGHAMFRIIVQDSRRTPTSGKLVAQIGHYDPHSKSISLLKDRAQFYLEHGAQPTPRVVGILKKEGVKLPKWVREVSSTPAKIRNPEKLRKNRPAEAKSEVVEEPKPIEQPEAEAIKEPQSDEIANEPAKTEDSEQSAPEEPEQAKAEEPTSEKAEGTSEEVSEKPAETTEEVPAESEKDKPKEETKQ